MYHIKETSTSSDHLYYDLQINSNPSLTSSISSSSSSAIIFNDTTTFDYIDSLDFDDVDDHIINQEISYQQRESHIKELHNSETNYIQHLESSINTYIRPLLHKNCLKTTSSSSSLSLLGIKKQTYSEKDIQCLFSNMETILELHKRYLANFNDRLAIWGPTQIISDVIQTLFPVLQNQYLVYFNNYDLAMATFDKLLRYSSFKKTINGIHHGGAAKLLSLLQAPTHYIQRHQELLNILIDHTSPMHPDYIGLVHCKNKFQLLVDNFKTKFEDMKNVDQVFKISQDMVDHPFCMKPNRRFLLISFRFTHFSKLSLAEERVCILFNDILVLAKQKSTGLHYKNHINLHKAKIRSLQKDYSIEITCPFHGVDTTAITPSVHVLRTFKKEDQLKWLSYLEATVIQLEKNRLLHRDTSSISDDCTSLSISS